MLFEKWRLNDRPLTEDILETLIVEASNLDRHWRACLRDNPALRGSDYNDKRRLVELQQLALGYEPGHHARNKKLKQL